MKTVVCINWGTVYGALYVARLHRMVAANLTPPFAFVCYCDDPDAIRAGVPDAVDVRPMPPAPCPPPTGVPGKWRKSCLWAPSLPGVEGVFLFLDLDVVVTGPLDDLFEVGAPGDLILARNAAKPFQRRGQTSIYRMPVGRLAPLYEAMQRDGQAIAERYRYEQFAVADRAPGGFRFWPWRWIRHFRIECVPRFPLNYLIPPRLPRGARVVIFAGGPNPDEVVAEVEPRSRGRHVREALKGPGAWKRLRRYRRPAPWVAERWTGGAPR